MARPQTPAGSSFTNLTQRGEGSEASSRSTSRNTAPASLTRPSEARLRTRCTSEPATGCPTGRPRRSRTLAGGDSRSTGRRSVPSAPDVGQLRPEEELPQIPDAAPIHIYLSNRRSGVCRTPRSALGRPPRANHRRVGNSNRMARRSWHRALEPTWALETEVSSPTASKAPVLTLPVR